MSFSPLTSGEVRTAELPREVLVLAEALARRHGDVMVARESSGLHLYMASPKCLEQDGWVELQKRHLAVNVDKHFRTGPWASKGNYNRARCAKCMKTDTPYTVIQLLNMPTLEQRGIKGGGSGVKVLNLERKLFPDGKGNMIPAPPGDCIPIVELPKDHPAVWYLNSRKVPFSLDTLWKQFRCSFCTREFKHPDVGYKRLPGGWRSTPQNRIIFFGDVRGVQVIWQARVLEFTDDSTRTKYYMHPYTGEWQACEVLDPETKKFVPLPHLVGDGDLKWEMPKYKTATGSSRQECLMGFDAAVEWNNRVRPRKRTAVVMEGPLDAGRVGPPGIPLTGKSMSEEQAKLLLSEFERVIYMGDNDAGGIKARKSVMIQLGSRLELVMLDPPDNTKDPGDTPDEVIWPALGPLLFT